MKEAGHVLYITSFMQVYIKYVISTIFVYYLHLSQSSLPNHIHLAVALRRKERCHPLILLHFSSNWINWRLLRSPSEVYYSHLHLYSSFIVFHTVWCQLLYTRCSQVSRESLNQSRNVHRLIYTMEWNKKLSVTATIWRWLFHWALLNNLNISIGPLRERRWICECSGRDSCILHFILNLRVSDLINKQIEMNRRRNAKTNAHTASFWGFQKQNWW